MKQLVDELHARIYLRSDGKYDCELHHGVDAPVDTYGSGKTVARAFNDAAEGLEFRARSGKAKRVAMKLAEFDDEPDE